VLVAVGLLVEVRRHAREPLIAEVLHVFLHETVVVAPIDAGRAHGGLFGPRRDLMRVQIMQVESIDQRLFHFLVEDEKPVGLNHAAAKSE
jgi:hypothetical protein